MKSVSLSGANVSISFIWSFYKTCDKGLREYRKQVVDSIRTGRAVPDQFLTMTSTEVEVNFADRQRELKFLVMLDMMSSVEASIWADYLGRVISKKKDDLSGKYRELNSRTQNDKVHLTDILESWQDAYPEKRKGEISDFKGSVKLRHWLAHGRYWTPKLGRKTYSPEDVYTICEGLLNIMSLPVS